MNTSAQQACIFFVILTFFPPSEADHFIISNGNKASGISSIYLIDNIVYPFPSEWGNIFIFYKKHQLFYQGHVFFRCFPENQSHIEYL